MAVRIKFDSAHNAEQPTFVLATRKGRLLGKLPVNNLQFKDALNSASTARFDVNKVDVPDNETIKETVHIQAFSFYNELNNVNTSHRLGQITENKTTELTNYFRTAEKISNPLLRIRKDGNDVKYRELKLSIVDYTLTISDSEDNIIITINDSGYVYIHNAASLGYETDDYVQVEFSFDVPTSAVSNKLWEQIKDFKLCWVREWNSWFELKVDITDGDGITKAVSATSLGEAELSQINLYNYEVNTETDIERDDYVPTVLFNESNPKASLLNRILEKAPHYTIAHVDLSIANIQRTFTFDNKSIYDAFQEIGEEINCLFRIRCYSDENGNIVREINVYDLESYCLECGHRGEYTDVCEECGSDNILTGYGEDTTIFISSENLGNDINFTTDTGSVKNCFKLEAGDDLMTATVANCNPNGSAYIWYISDEVKNDMTSELVARLNEYDIDYNYYQNEYTISVNADLLSQYNALIDKYSEFTNDYSHMPSSIVGYPNLMKEYYNTIDFYLFLNDTLMPSVEISRTTAGLEAAKLNTLNLSPVAVQDITRFSLATATNAVLQMAKTIVDSRYQVKVKESLLDETTWIGIFTVTNYSDEEDTYNTGSVHVSITDDYERFVKQKIDKVLSKQSEEVTDIVGLFKLNSTDFATELKRYCLSRLSTFHECCQSCIDILIEQGIADRETWANQNPDLYRDLYTPYYTKLGLITDEIAVRENEIAILTGTYDSDGDLAIDGVQTILLSEQEAIQDLLDFEKYLGDELWLEFSAYRREDTYSNNNYISDGLDNAELFENALSFVEVAKKDIYKSATMQHSITSSLKNLLVMKEFEPLVDYFEVGNWLRIRVDNKVYMLRLIEYNINYDNLENLSVTFSDVKIVKNGITDVASIQEQAKSMASSYGSVSRQADKGKKSNDRLNDWVNKGLALTKMKIIDNADNQNITWDSHGILCTEYLPITDSYDDKQLKIINKGLYLTDDNWLTSRAGIGNFAFYNPETGDMEEAYGVIADTLVGNLVLSEKVGVYNMKNSIVLGENGLVITTDNTHTGENQMAFTIQRKALDGDDNEYITQIMYIDSNGNLVLNGSININTSADNGISTLDELTDVSRFTGEINNSIYRVLNTNDENVMVFVTDANGDIQFDANGNPLMEESTVSGLYSKIDAQYNNSVAYTQYMLNKYQAEVSQYMTFDSENGLTLGATGSTFRTVIDNMRMAFWDGNTVAAYISNSQLYIPNAVIEKTLTLGKFYFSPRSDGGVSLTWQGD